MYSRPGASGHRTFNPHSRPKPIDFSNGFQFSRALKEHKSCINAIGFSHGDGRWLASAGDDLRLLLWDFHQEQLTESSGSFSGHRGNIFCLDFSLENNFVFTGSTDSKVLKYDLSRLGTSIPQTPCHTFARHENYATVTGISCSPTDENVVLSVSEDGNIILNDSRVSDSSPPPGIVQVQSGLTDVKFHPEADKLFLISDSRGSLSLRDTRIAFGNESRQRSGGVVIEYITTVTRLSSPRCVRPEPASIAFDRRGYRFAALFSNYLPTIYSTSDPLPIAVCSGRNLPDGSRVPEGQRTYSNKCTIKHGSFGGPLSDNDEYFCTGSDDFRAYAWKIPDTPSLIAERQLLDLYGWDGVPRSTVGFVQSNARCIPVQLDTPAFRLHGHKSIVNSAVFHPVLPQVVTAGVERHMVLHNPSHTAPNAGFFQRTDTHVRQISLSSSAETENQYRRALLRGPPDPFHPSFSEEAADEQTLDFFDGVIRENETSQLFTTRPPIDSSSSSSSDEDA